MEEQYLSAAEDAEAEENSTSVTTEIRGRS